MRPRHPSVADGRSAAREDARVVGLDVRMHADHRGDQAVEPSGERDLLARRLGMEVDDDDRRRRPRLLDERVDHLPRGDGRGQKELAEQVDDGDGAAVSRLDHG